MKDAKRRCGENIAGCASILAQSHEEDVRKWMKPLYEDEDDDDDDANDSDEVKELKEITVRIPLPTFKSLLGRVGFRAGGGRACRGRSGGWDLKILARPLFVHRRERRRRRWPSPGRRQHTLERRTRTARRSIARIRKPDRTRRRGITRVLTLETHRCAFRTRSRAGGDERRRGRRRLGRPSRSSSSFFLDEGRGGGDGRFVRLAHMERRRRARGRMRKHRCRRSGNLGRPRNRIRRRMLRLVLLGGFSSWRLLRLMMVVVTEQTAPDGISSTTCRPRLDKYGLHGALLALRGPGSRSFALCVGSGLGCRKITLESDGLDRCLVLFFWTLFP